MKIIADNVTFHDVLSIANFAKKRGLEFDMIPLNEASTKCSYTKVIEIYQFYSPAQMFNEIHRKCLDQGHNFFQGNFDELKRKLDI